jgi:hypothetical protein
VLAAEQGIHSEVPASREDAGQQRRRRDEQ